MFLITGDYSWQNDYLMLSLPSQQDGLYYSLPGTFSTYISVQIAHLMALGFLSVNYCAVNNNRVYESFSYRKEKYR